MDFLRCFVVLIGLGKQNWEFLSLKKLFCLRGIREHLCSTLGNVSVVVFQRLWKLPGAGC
jgi:hypothetical protein